MEKAESAAYLYSRRRRAAEALGWFAGMTSCRQLITLEVVWNGTWWSDGHRVSLAGAAAA